MLRVNGVEAWISDETKSPFTVYGVEKDASAGVVSCWIAYEPGMVRHQTTSARDPHTDSNGD